jgi:hypothetical protein
MALLAPASLALTTSRAPCKCRRCDVGGDVIALVMHLDDVFRIPQLTYYDDHPGEDLPARAQGVGQPRAWERRHECEVSASHCFAAAPWHLGQCRLRQVMGDAHYLGIIPLTYHSA